MTSPRKHRSPLRPIVVALFTAALSSAVVVGLFGVPRATAQPAPAAPAAPAAGSATTAGSATGSAAAESPAPAEGSAVAAAPAPTAGSAAAPAAGSAAPAAGSAAPAAGAPAAAAAPAAPAGLPWYEELANKPIEESGNFWFPKAVNKATDSSDMMFIAVLALSIFFFSAITFLVIYFVWKYRHRPGHKAEPSPAHHDVMEITWTILPTIIVVFLFYYGWRSYIHIVTPPQKAVEVNVRAKQWSWSFTHSNGYSDSDLHVPVDTPVRLVMTSDDVLHAFYVPVLRTKQDIIPRRYTYVWFQATKPGTYSLHCAEYCGTDHSQMGRKYDDKTKSWGRRAVIVVHEKGGYERYLAETGASNDPPEVLGRKLYDKKGCTSCHSVDGSTRVGPSFKGTFGQPVPLQSGGTVPMDENYIRESLMVPSAKARPGFPATAMPSFSGQLKEKEIEGLIAFIKSLQ